MPLLTQTQVEVRETAPVFVVRESPLETSRAARSSIISVVASVLVAFLIVIFAAFALRWIEGKVRAGQEQFQRNFFLQSKIDTARNFLIPTAHAATLPAPRRIWEAQKFITSGDKLELFAGDEAIFTIGFKNIGSREWRNDSRNYISIYTAKPYYRNSIFKTANWISQRQVSRLREMAVPSGGIGYLEIPFKAPDKPGTYTETFSLAAENLLWMPGGQFSVTIIVSPKPVHQAMLLLRSHRDLTLKQGEEVTLRMGWKNNGSVPWTDVSVKGKSLEMGSDFSSPPSTFSPGNWSTSEEPMRILGANVSPGQIGFIDFTLRAPSRPGRFVIKFALAADGAELPGGELEVLGNVTDESLNTNLPGSSPMLLAAEPNIRIGLCYLAFSNADSGQLGMDPCAADKSAPLLVTSPTPLILKSGSDSIISPNIGTSVSIQFDPVSKFTVIANGATYSFSDSFRLVPQELATVLVFDSWKNLIASGENDNRQHGILEFRYIENRQRVWAINELPLDLYVKGIAEIPADWPIAVQKAQAIAARTYALYYVLAGGKHASQSHILNSGFYDQVYHGHGAELRRPALTRAVEETRGEVVTYNGEVVSTPYFAQSDGRTRSWGEVYGVPPRPWLQSVPTIYDVGKTMRGHGIGMSQMDAYGRAKAGAPYEDIIKYYYTGIELKRAY